MNFISKLAKFGLTENEAKVYITCLELGPTTVMTIATHAELKRPNTYLILDELIRKGLISIVPREKKKLFVAENPQKLVEDVQEKFYEFQGIVPELKTLYNTKAVKPMVLLYQGKEGILKIYKEIVASGEKEILSFYSIENVSREFYETFSYFIKMLKNNPEIVSREIGYLKNFSHYYLNETRELANHKIRHVTEKNQFFTDNIIYLNRVAIFSFTKRFVIVIESKDIADSFRSIFELAWQSAKDLSK